EVEKELRQLETADLRDQLPKIKCPTLIIQGDQDEICLPAAARSLVGNIKNSELVMLAGVGHAPMVEAPDKFYALVNNYA
ncbi:MAG TPA: alpha/beta hydrolase, partial [Candidatus Sulfotelmatobacter sp.]|nr:alpha/beta hydrolase [Candidatus Sulfotelmatobacter sp.]